MKASTVHDFYGIPKELSNGEKLKKLYDLLYLRISVSPESNSKTEPVITETPQCDLFSVDPKDKDFCYCKGKKIPFAWCLKQYAKSQQKGWKRCYPPYESFKPRNYPQQRRSQPSKDHFCLLHQRRIPHDQLPTNECFNCPNTECSKAVGEIVNKTSW